MYVVCLLIFLEVGKIGVEENETQHSTQPNNVGRWTIWCLICRRK